MVVFSALRKEDCTVRVMYRVRVWACLSHVGDNGRLIGGSPEHTFCGDFPCVNGQVSPDEACGGGSFNARSCSCGGEIRAGWLYWLDSSC
jgi:hypothetical protein